MVDLKRLPTEFRKMTNRVAARKGVVIKKETGSSFKLKL